ncbi:DUF488 domain-containing protein [Luteibacter aegosomaticola]|uniref:DUF488 domain-containing protein n=1 Tax=Luteibacter aegosomaticola TaxID=2911538 RepID=UPI001FF7E75C|nr:DUF488 domain-containing protein [Luteibacter aegosomaticola]UPG91734.1 DUF488 domain-containing protein [Luteibacter aegosomaticola]
MKSPPLFTVGHSTRTTEDFLAVLLDAGVACLVDVRAFPRSRTNPQFNQDVLPAALASAGIGYEHLPGLAGRRRKSVVVAPDVNAYWKVAGFHNYADYALSESFQASFRDLMRVSAAKPAAMMCSEVLWWRCHRRIIADYALAEGREVRHLFDVGHVEEARLTDAAVAHADGTITYPG